ncbi:hypothetical protein C5S42_07820 [Candidatus Methanomarinus sp.]|nr:hypothetical protein C5S42_07820 [ANME-2 cluster archaeon]
MLAKRIILCLDCDLGVREGRETGREISPDDRYNIEKLLSLWI